MTTIAAVIEQARGVESDDITVWLTQQFCWLKLYDRAHSQELAQTVVAMDSADMLAYLRRLLSSELGSDLPKFMAAATRKKELYDAVQRQKIEGTHPDRVLRQATDGLTLRRLAKEDSSIADAYSSRTLKQAKREKAAAQSRKNRELKEARKQEEEAKAAASREPCNCQATEHPLIGNCLRCGKIICALEGHGPCLFCAEYLPPEQQRQDAATSDAEALRAAIERKNTILRQDKSRSYTQIIDDQMDHYDMDDRWMSPSEREAMRKEREARAQAEEEAKRRIGLTLDFGSGQVTALSRDEMVKQALDAQSKLADVRCSAAVSAVAGNATQSTAEQRFFHNPYLDVEAPVWLGKEAAIAATAAEKRDSLPVVSTEKPRARVQDDRLLPVDDEQ